MTVAAVTSAGQPMPEYIDSHCHMDEILERLRFSSYRDYKVCAEATPYVYLSCVRACG
jgi:hypothetical protein